MKQNLKYEKTVIRKKYLKSLGYTVHEIWECDFKRWFLYSTETIRNRYTPRNYRRHKYAQSQDTLLKAIQTGELFGMAEVDIAVPEAWQGDFRSELSPFEYFKEFSPIFCTTEVQSDVIGPHMMQHCLDHNVPLNSRRLLVGGMKAKQILLSTTLLRWYLDHGLVVTKMYEVIEFSPLSCFKNFVEKCTDARRQSDRDSSLALLGDTFKILLNAAYGSSLLNKENFSDTSYMRGHASLKIQVNKPEFQKATLLTDEIYELQKGKRRLTLDIPIHIGFSF